MYDIFPACDPFSRRGPANNTSSFDDPPSTFENKKRKRSLDWDNEDDRELLLQREAKRELRLSQSVEANKVGAIVSVRV